MRCKLTIQLVIALIFGIMLNIQAQPQKSVPAKVRCGTDHAMKALYKAHPEALKEAQEFERSSNEKATKATTYVIPTVFHVFGTYFNNGTTVTDGIVIDALERTNEDFQGITSDWNNIIYEFNGVKQPLSITFALAQIDPDGNPTTGINYYSERSGFGNDNGYDSQIQYYAWDNYKYFNVYIMRDLYNDGDYYNSGVCWYPNTWMSDNDLARCVYNGSYLGSNTSENFRSVLSHEFGHYLNLIHPFQGGCPDDNGCNYSGDMICDTPPVDHSGMQGSDYNCEGNITNWQNFMHYSDQYAMFTQQQVSRMKSALSHSTRYPLWQQSNLEATGVLDGGSGLSRPTGLENNNVTSSSFTGEWNSVSETTVYDVQLWDDYAEDWKNEGSTYNTSYTFTGLPAGSDQWWRVRARNSEKTSSYSDYLTVTLKTDDGSCSYCSSSSIRSSYEHIAKVEVGSFTNTSGANNYSNFTNKTISVDKGRSYSVRLTPGFSEGAYAEYFKMWIDLNGDCDFNDSGELVFDAGGTSTSAVSGTINIPSSAKAGKTRARVSMRYNAAPTACMDAETFDDGEVEDYTVEIGGDGGNDDPVYCDAQSNSTSYEYISRVRFGSIDRSSGSNGYDDHTSVSTSLNAGSTTNLYITTTGNYEDDEIVVFIDYNRDGDFTDSGEEVYHNTNAGTAQTYSASITPPYSAASGDLRMRIVLYDAGYDSKTSCGNFDYGEVEDYTVRVSGTSGPVAKKILKAYPSPADNFVFVETINRKDKIEIYDATGRLTKSLNVKSNIEKIDVKGIPPGLYLIKQNQSVVRVLVK